MVKLNHKVLKNNILYTFLVALFLFSSNAAFAADAGSGSNILNLSLWGVAILVIFFLIIQVSDNLIRIEAKESGLDDKAQASVSPPKQQFILAQTLLPLSLPLLSHSRF